MTSTASTTGPYDLGLLEEPGRAGCRGGVKLPHRGKWKRNEVLSSFDCSAFFNHRMGRSSMTFGFRDRLQAPMKKNRKVGISPTKVWCQEQSASSFVQAWALWVLFFVGRVLVVVGVVELFTMENYGKKS